MPSRSALVVLAAVAAVTSLAAGVAGLAADGELDPTFDGDGLWVASNSGSYSFTRAARDPDGNLVVYGTRSAGGLSYFHWRRILPTGAGALCTYFPANSSLLRLGGIAFDSAGRLLLGGSLRVGTADPVVVVLRYVYPACDLDETLDGSGFAAHATGIQDAELIGVGGVSHGRWLVPPALFRNRILIPMGVSIDGQATSTYLLRLRDDGAVDTNFGGGDGSVELVPERYPTAIAGTHDGRWLVSGLTDDTSGLRSFVFKIDHEGVLDADFGAAGETIVNLPSSSEDRLTYLAVGGDGRIAMTGRTDLSDGSFTTQAAVALLRADGTLDPSFNGTGWRVWRRPGTDETIFLGAAFQGDRRLVIAGRADDPANFDDDEGIALRLLPQGALDPTFATAGWRLFDLDNSALGEDMGVGVEILADGRIWLAGSTQVEVAPGDTDYKPFVALLRNRYLFADGFERGSTANW
jgi:uncharacterized delta-60 repeat protein